MASGAPRVVPDSVPARLDEKLLHDDRVLQNLLDSEEKNLPNPSYFTCVQTEVKPHMREILTNWMGEVCQEEKAEPDTFPLAVHYLDRFLSVVNVHKHQLQVLGAACLFISSKLRQTNPFSAFRLVTYTDDSISLTELMSWELLVLGRLRWDMCGVTPNDFLPHLISRLQIPMEFLDKISSTFNQFLSLVLTEFRLAILPASIQACGCLCSTLKQILGRTDMMEELLKYLKTITNTDLDVLRPYVTAIDRFVEDRENRKCVMISSPSTPVSASKSNNDPSTPTDVRDVQLSGSSGLMVE